MPFFRRYFPYLYVSDLSIVNAKDHYVLRMFIYLVILNVLFKGRPSGILAINRSRGLFFLHFFATFCVPCALKRRRRPQPEGISQIDLQQLGDIVTKFEGVLEKKPDGDRLASLSGPGVL